MAEDGFTIGFQCNRQTSRIFYKQHFLIMPAVRSILRSLATKGNTRRRQGGLQRSRPLNHTMLTNFPKLKWQGTWRCGNDCRRRPAAGSDLDVTGHVPALHVTWRRRRSAGTAGPSAAELDGHIRTHAPTHSHTGRPVATFS